MDNPEVKLIVNEITDNQKVIDFLNSASMNDMIAVANVMNIIDGNSPNFAMSLVDYQIINSALETITEDSE